MIPFPFLLTNTVACYQTALQDLKARKVHQGLKVVKGLKVIKGPLVIKDLLVTKALSDLKDLPGGEVRWWFLRA